MDRDIYICCRIAASLQIAAAAPSSHLAFSAQLLSSVSKLLHPVLGGGGVQGYTLTSKCCTVMMFCTVR